MHVKSQRTRDVGQAGASLLIALGVLAFLMAIVGAMVALNSGSTKRVKAYENVREARYAGDGAIKAAVNWAKDNPNVAVDPAYFGTDANGNDSNANCVYQIVDVNLGPVTASCHTEEDSNSGVPEQQGKTPPEALLLLGARHNEPGPYSTNGCSKSWFSGAFADVLSYLTGNQGVWDGTSERSLSVRPLKRYINGSCKNFARDFNAVKVQGPIVAAGEIGWEAGTGSLTVYGDGTQRGSVMAKYGCVNGSTTIVRLISVTDTSEENECNDWPSGNPTHGPHARPLDQDPGRVSGTKTPIGDIADEYLSVGFNADGTSKADSVVRHVRTSAYTYEQGYVSADTSVPLGLKPIVKQSGYCTSAAISNAQAIIFLPGWYKDVNVLNQFTADPRCADRTVWFAPDAGPDRVLLTEDDKTGPFYMDFESGPYTGPSSYNSTTYGCGMMPNRLINNRWCVGGSDSAEIRVVVGTPDGWSPIGSAVGDPGDWTGNPDGGHGGGEVRVALSKAGTIDDVDANFWERYILNPLLRPWKNLSNAKDFDTAAYATYRPCSVNFFNLFRIYCPTLGSRTTRITAFTPKATRAPVSLPGAPNGKINVEFKYGLNTVANTKLNPPIIEIETIDTLGRTLFCGSYNVERRLWNPGGPDPMPVVGFSDADQIRLANTCGTKSQINEYRIYLKMTGSQSNNDGPEIYVGGVRISYVSYMGARFPYPVDGSSENAAAQSDCDAKALAGGQLIFGGNSHVYVADGSLEVCAGVYPADDGESANHAAANHQVIGVYGIPAVDPVYVTTVSPTVSGNETHEWYGESISDTQRASRLKIGEPFGGRFTENKYSSQSAATRQRAISYKTGCGLCSQGHLWSGIDLTFERFVVPSGYHITEVKARVSAKQAQEGDGSPGPKRWCQDDSILADISGCDSIADGLVFNDGDGANKTELYSSINATRWNQVADKPEYILFKEGASPPYVKNHSSKGSLVDQLTSPSGLSARWVGRIRCLSNLGIRTCAGSNWDQLDGVELDVTIAPNSSSVPMLRPQSGCIVAHPNYFGGAGEPDCAVVRANLWNVESSANSNLICSVFNTSCDTRLRGNWNGRFSVKGTLYAPSSAVEIDDQDIAYPFATRGAVLRHLLLTGWAIRTEYADPVISNEVDRTPQPRRTVFSACVQSEARRAANEPCDAEEDRIISQAGVTFAVANAGGSTPAANADVPLIQWWSDRQRALRGD